MPYIKETYWLILRHVLDSIVIVSKNRSVGRHQFFTLPSWPDSVRHPDTLHLLFQHFSLTPIFPVDLLCPIHIPRQVNFQSSPCSSTPSEQPRLRQVSLKRSTYESRVSPARMITPSEWLPVCHTWVLALNRCLRYLLHSSKVAPAPQGADLSTTIPLTVVDWPHSQLYWRPAPPTSIPTAAVVLLQKEGACSPHRRHPWSTLVQSPGKFVLLGPTGNFLYKVTTFKTRRHSLAFLHRESNKIRRQRSMLQMKNNTKPHRNN